MISVYLKIPKIISTLKLICKRSVKHMCQKANSICRFILIYWQKHVMLLCRSSDQLGQRVSQIKLGVDPKLLTGGSKVRQNSFTTFRQFQKKTATSFSSDGKRLFYQLVGFISLDFFHIGNDS